MTADEARERLRFLEETYRNQAFGNQEHKDYYINLATACSYGATAIENDLREVRNED